MILKLLLGVVLYTFMVGLPTTVESTEPSHYEYYLVAYTYATYNCYPYYYTQCYNWWYYGYWYGYYYWNWYWWYPYYYRYWCWTAVNYNCYYNWHTGYYQAARCQAGWSGGICNVPICNPSCGGNQVCTKPNICDCVRNAAGNCELKYCTSPAGRNCYPGTCSLPSTCLCPPGFSGDNCQIVSQRSNITVCSAQVYGQLSSSGPLQVIATAAQCTAVGDNDPPTIWINTTLVNKIETTWEVHYYNPPTLPDNTYAPYIQNAPVTLGISDTNFVVKWGTNSGVSTSCPITTKYPNIVQCNPVVQPWTNIGFTIQNNATFIIQVSSKVGGEKVNGSLTQPFTEDPSGNASQRLMKFGFDLTPPSHCLTNSNNCTIFPIFVNKSITSDPKIQPTFNQWKDTESGIDRFHVEIFYMQPDYSGQLVEVGSALSQKDVNININDFQFTCDKAGVYSIILTVYDRAGNSAKARKIVMYNDQPVAITNSPMFLDKADPTTIDAATGHAFINKLDPPQDGFYHFTANWTGHFQNNYHPEWLARAKSWQDSGLSGIDDRYGNTFSMRSIDQVTGLTGIIAFSYAYAVDSVGGIGAIPPENFTNLEDKQTTLTIDIPQNELKNGQTIVVWVKAYDITGSSNIIVSKSFVDIDPFNINITSQTFKTQSSDQFNSSVYLNVVSKISGIKNISYQIFDKTLQAVIKSVTIPPRTLRPVSQLGSIKKRDIEIPCNPINDSTCYCIPLGTCYNKTQEILIDNCWIDRYADDHLEITYTINNLAGLSRSGSIDLGTLKPEDILCRPSPKSGSLSSGAIAGIVIGIIIGVIFLIIAIILFVLSRIRPNHAIPTRMRTMAHTVHNRFARPELKENELYCTKLEYVKIVNEPKFISAVFENKETFGCSVSSKDVQVAEVIAEGRFATIRKGYFCKNNEKIMIAIKALRRDHAQRDDDLMRSKILFMATKVKTHPNIVKFIGAMEDENSSDAPVMLLELCDIPLKDWLSDIVKITTDELENMLTFSLNIACGVEHLHKQKIIHRRLAVRNVLLKNGMSGLEAKLIGFGPSRDIAEDNPNDDNMQQEQVVVPMKWCAPETLESLSSRKPVYDAKTDAWSYGITLWEMYSKGDAPYSIYRSNDMREVLKRGERLQCPADCPPELFNQVVYPCWNISPNERPSFNAICTDIHKFRCGSDEGTSYYAANEEGTSGGGSDGYYAGAPLNPSRCQTQLYHDAR